MARAARNAAGEGMGVCVCVCVCARARVCVGSYDTITIAQSS
jgi:hypothetical protein